MALLLFSIAYCFLLIVVFVLRHEVHSTIQSIPPRPKSCHDIDFKGNILFLIILAWIRPTMF